MAQLHFLRERSALFNIFFLSALALTSVGIFSLLSFVVIQLGWGLPVFEDQTILSDYSNPVVVSALKFVQTMYSFGLFIAPCFIFLMLAGENAASFLKMRAFPPTISILLVLLIIIVVQPLVELTGAWNAEFPFPEILGIADWIKQTEEQGEIITKTFLKADSVSVYLLNVFIMAFLPALGEEIFFRGMIQTWVIKGVKNVSVGIVITAIIFSAFHFQFLGFIPRMLLGIILGCIFVWSKNIWLAVFAHFVNNGAGVTLDYLTQQNIINQEELETAASDNTLLVITSIVLLGALMFGLYKQNGRELQPE